jgi:DNA-binding IclR family transcriptional regulator
VYAHRSSTLVVHPELDPALLAFVKCHITSFVKWDVLRLLSEREGEWAGSSDLAHKLNRPVEKVEEALDELSDEGIVATFGPSSDRSYRLYDGDPNTVVIERLMANATRSQDLRRIVVAHILQGAVA